LLFAREDADIHDPICYQGEKHKIITELTQERGQHVSLFEYFYYPDDAETLNAHAKNIIDWLKRNRMNLRLMTSDDSGLWGEVLEEKETQCAVWAPIEDRARKVSQDLDGLESRLACRSRDQSNLFAVSFP